MLARGVALTCVLAACYKPGYDNCEISCASGFCPAGLQCTEGFCITPGSVPCGSNPMPDSNGDAPPDQLGPPGDKDNDTILDPVDNCVDTPNPEQFNEDMDDHGDACDRCPPIADNNDPDGDGDGVGDRCDPRPGLQDTLFLFEGFRGQGPPPGIVMKAPEYMFAPGVVNVSIPSDRRVHVLWSGPSVMGETITARVYNDAVHPGGTVAGTGVIHRAPGLDNGGVACVVGRDGNQDRVILYDVTSKTRIATGPVPMSVGPVLTMTSKRMGDQYTCGVETAPSISASQAANGPLAGLHAHLVDGQFDWIMIVASP